MQVYEEMERRKNLTIINNLKSIIRKHETELKDAIRLDYERCRYKTNFEDLYKILERESVNQNSHEEYCAKIQEAKNIAVFYDGNAYVTLTLALYAIQSSKKISFYVVDRLLAINSLLVEMIRIALRENKSHNCGVYFESVDSMDDFTKIHAKFDTLMYVGEKYLYERWPEELKKKSIYNGYGTVVSYIDDNINAFNDELEGMNRYIYYNSINIYNYYGEQVDEIISEISKGEVNETLIVYSKSKEKAMSFIRDAKYKKIYINKNPFDDYALEFKNTLLIGKKNIIM